MAKKSKNISVRFTQQQLELLDNLKEEGKFGGNYSKIVVNVLREYIKQTFRE